MHEIEPSGFCSIEDYEKYYEKRAQASQLSIDGLYLAMAMLKRGSKDKAAFKFPLTVLAVDLRRFSRARVDVNLLDQDLRPVSRVALDMHDGIAKNPSIMEVSTRKPVDKMYLKDYGDFLGDDFRKVPTTQDIAWDELGGDLMPSPLQVIH